eukprot:9596396-Heterocapsa_arctica.AAC.1
MSDLAHIKVREQDWAAGLGLHFDTFFTNCRQEEVAKRSLQKTINIRGKPECFRDIWEDKLQGCTDWSAQRLIDFSAEFEAIGVRRNTEITQERCENLRKWSAEAMDNGAPSCTQRKERPTQSRESRTPKALGNVPRARLRRSSLKDGRKSGTSHGRTLIEDS